MRPIAGGAALRLVFLLVLLPVGKQSQRFLQPTEVELGLQVGVEFDKILETNMK